MKHQARPPLGCMTKPVIMKGSDIAWSLTEINNLLHWADGGESCIWIHLLNHMSALQREGISEYRHVKVRWFIKHNGSAARKRSHSFHWMFECPKAYILETHIHLRPYSKRLLVSPQELKVAPRDFLGPVSLVHIEDLRLVVGFCPNRTEMARNISALARFWGEGNMIFLVLVLPLDSSTVSSFIATLVHQNPQNTTAGFWYQRSQETKNQSFEMGSRSESTFKPLP